MGPGNGVKRVVLALLGALVLMLAAAAGAEGAPFLYAMGFENARVWQFDLDGGALAPLDPPSVATERRPKAIAVTPDSRFAYVADSGSFTITGYAVRHGGLVRVGSEPAISDAEDLAIAPDGQHLYEIGWHGMIEAFSVGGHGELRRIGVLEAPSTQRSIVLTPDGRHAYVARYDSAVTEFAVGEDGELRQIGTVGSCAGAHGMGVTPDGRHVYVVCSTTHSISEFAVGTDGHLAPLGTILAGRYEAWALAITPDSQHLYAAAMGGGGIGEYDIGPAGHLRQVGAVHFEADVHALEVSPDGRHLYMADHLGEGIVSFGIDAAGRLHPQAGSQLDARPSALAVTGRTPIVGHGRVGRDSDGRLEVFVLRDGELWDYRQPEPGGPLPSEPVRIGGHHLVGRPVVAATRDGRLAVVVVDGEHGHVHLAIQHRAGGDFGPLRSLGDPDPHDPAIPSHAAIAANANGLLEVFVTRHGEGLSALRQSHDGTFPETWHDLGGTTRGGPAAATSRDGLIEVVTRDRDGQLLSWYQHHPDGHFIGPERQLPSDRFSADPELIREDDGRLVVFARHAGDGHVYTDAQRPASERFAREWTDLGGPGGDGPPDATPGADGNLVVIARDRHNGLSAARQTRPGAHFHAWTDLGNVRHLGFVPAALADVSARISVFATTHHTGRLYVNRQLRPDGDFERWFSYVGEGR